MAKAGKAKKNKQLKKDNQVPEEIRKQKTKRGKHVIQEKKRQTSCKKKEEEKEAAKEKKIRNEWPNLGKPRKRNM